MAWGRVCSGFSVAVLLVILAVSTGGSAQSENYWDEFVTPLPENPHADCTAWDNCLEELKGISYQDHYVAPFLGGADPGDPPTYNFLSHAKPVAVSYNPIVAWEMCTYDGDHELLNCEHLEGESRYAGEVNPDTEYIRVILRQGLTNSYGLALFL